MFRRLTQAARRSLRFDLLLTLLLVAAALTLISKLPQAAAERPEGNARVMDGDSLKLAGVETRLEGIDAPELHQTCMRNAISWPCGREASRLLRRKVTGRPVICEGRERDQYGRLLGRCVSNGTDLNRWMVEQGYAVSYDDYPDAERAARDAKRGLWSGSFERPHDWRVRHAGG